MKITPTALHGVVLIEPEVLADDRGWFAERFRQDVFEAGLRELGLPAPAPFVQENQSSSGLGVLRGLHYQLAPHAQGKLVSVVAGEVFDVAVDIRGGSPTLANGWASGSRPPIAAASGSPKALPMACCPWPRAAKSGTRSPPTMRPRMSGPCAGMTRPSASNGRPGPRGCRRATGRRPGCRRPAGWGNCPPDQPAG